MRETHCKCKLVRNAFLSVVMDTSWWLLRLFPFNKLRKLIYVFSNIFSQSQRQLGDYILKKNIPINIQLSNDKHTRVYIWRYYERLTFVQKGERTRKSPPEGAGGGGNLPPGGIGPRQPISFTPTKPHLMPPLSLVANQYMTRLPFISFFNSICVPGKKKKRYIPDFFPKSKNISTVGWVGKKPNAGPCRGGRCGVKFGVADSFAIPTPRRQRH